MLIARHLGFVLVASTLLATYACVGDDPGSTSSSSGGQDDGGSSSGGSSGNTSSGDAATCEAPKTTCGSACVDTKTDNAHCGACDNACQGTTCYNGVCDGARVKQVATGSALSCALRVDGSVYCWGRGDYAALGERFEGSAGEPCLGSTARCQPTPMKVKGLEPAEAITIGHQNACAITKKGELWCWGRNHNGEVGPLATSPTCGDAPCIDKPTRIDGISGVVEASMGLHHMCARTTVGDVYCWGGGVYGGLGTGSENDVVAPTKVNDVSNATSLSVSGDQFGHTCVGTSAGVKCWGYDVQRSLGRSTQAPATCTGNTNCSTTPALADGTGITTSVQKVIAGASHTCALDQGGTVRCWGYHGYHVGPLAGPSPAPRAAMNGVVTFAGHYAHACGVRTDGTVACWGHSGTGRLGFLHPANETACVPGVSWPCNDGEPDDVSGVGPVSAIDAMDTVIVLTRNGEIHTWGPNDNGLIGVPPQAGPKQCPTFGNGVSTGVTTPCTNVPTQIVLPP